MSPDPAPGAPPVAEIARVEEQASLHFSEQKRSAGGSSRFGDVADDASWVSGDGVTRVLRRMVAGALHDAVATLFPANCRLCEMPLLRAGAIPVCERCLAEPRPQGGPMCERCGEALDLDFEADRFGPGTAEPLLCALCREAPPAFARAVAFGTYEATLRELIHLFKYEGVTALRKPMGAWLVQAMDGLRGSFAGEAGTEWLVIAVPLARAKARGRGFNQALLLARSLVRCAEGATGGVRLRLRPELLRRLRRTESQFGLTPHQRRANVRGAFAVTDAAKLQGRSVLLVDDIYTTGATARACSEVLRQAGARQVLVVTLARAQAERVALWDASGAERFAMVPGETAVVQ